MIAHLVGGDNDGRKIEYDGYPVLRMAKKREHNRSFFKYTPGEPVIPDQIEMETYTRRVLAFKHRGLWCKTEAYVIEGMSDDEAAKALNQRDTQQDW